MPLSLLVSCGLLAAPAFLIAALARVDGSRIGNVFRFVVAFLLFAPFILGLRKFVMAPMTFPDMRFYLGGSIEQIPLVGFFFTCGLPGLIWRRGPRTGFFFAYLILGAALTFMLTFGIIVERGVISGLHEILAYIAIAIFLFLWSRGGKASGDLRTKARGNDLRRVEPPLQS